MAWWCNGRATESRSNAYDDFGFQLGSYQVTTVGQFFTPML